MSQTVWQRFLQPRAKSCKERSRVFLEEKQQLSSRRRKSSELHNTHSQPQKEHSASGVAFPQTPRATREMAHKERHPGSLLQCANHQTLQTLWCILTSLLLRGLKCMRTNKKLVSTRDGIKQKAGFNHLTPLLPSILASEEFASIKTTMDVNPSVLIFFYGQMWWNYISAETQRPANFSSPTTLPTVTTTVGNAEITSQTHPTQTRKSGDSIKNNRPLSTAKPQHPITEKPKSHNEHIIAAVVIGVILIVMIVVIVGIFLWRRWKTAALPLPHWAGRSPFADGDLPEVTADKEVANGLMRVSVLSLLPWKFSKETQLLKTAEGSLSESKHNLDASSRCDTEETESSPAVTGNSVSSTSEQTAISGEPDSLVEVPLQAHSPEPLDLPPPPNWLGGTTGDLSPGPSKSFSPEPNAEIRCPVSDVSYQNPSETLLFPPPPDELLSN